MIARVLALGALLAPSAAALDTLPDASRFDAREARLLVRLPEGGAFVVRTDGAARVALAEPEGAPGAFVPVPARFVVEARAPAASWHGLPGTVEVVLVREDPRRALFVVLEDESGVGAEFEWPAERRVPGAGAWAFGLAVLGASALRPTRREM